MGEIKLVSDGFVCFNPCLSSVRKLDTHTAILRRGFTILRNFLSCGLR